MARSHASAPPHVTLSLATLESAVPQGAEWQHEAKLDGYRMQAVLVRDGDTPRVTLLTRNDKDWTARFPTIAAAVRALPVRGAILDGEIVAVVARGRSAFQALQQAGPAPSGDGTSVQYVCFDLLWLDGTDLRRHPLRERQTLLRLLLRHRPARAPLRFVKRFAVSAGDPLQAACAAGLEGIVSKRRDGVYVTGRHRGWLKIKCIKRQEFVVVGYTEPRGSRTGFGALLLAVHDAAGQLVFAGKVGTGFDSAGLASLHTTLQRLRTSAPSVQRSSALPRRDVHWVKPTLVAEIAFTEWTADGLLRHPVFHGLRDDKPAREVVREEVT